MRRQAQPFASFADGLAHTGEIQMLQIAQTAMQGAQTVARSTRSEITPLDQRNAQAQACCLPGGASTVDAAADHQDVEGFARQRRQIAVHAAFSASPANRLRHN